MSPDERDLTDSADDEPDETIARAEAERTLYALAGRAMERYIEAYVTLVDRTDGLRTVRAEMLEEVEHRRLLLGGIGSPLDPNVTSAADSEKEYRRMTSVPFDVEKAVTSGVYVELRARAQELTGELEKASEGFMHFDPKYISAHPFMLALFMRLANITSKAELRLQIGSASDHAVSIKAATRLAELLNERLPGRRMSREQLVQSVEQTLEGIVRDLVGKVLLESIVVNALKDAGVPYQREGEYGVIKGVVYDFRADFVIPNGDDPLVVIEVRKSSTRHASLYAKDKMFSAINWKGAQQNLMAVLITEGPWTRETLSTMARIFDYVVPMSEVAGVARVIAAYVNGDKSKLRWLVQFKIKDA